MAENLMAAAEGFDPALLNMVHRMLETLPIRLEA
jgi:hypothetical protein